MRGVVEMCHFSALAGPARGPAAPAVTRSPDTESPGPESGGLRDLAKTGRAARPRCISSLSF
eukprot:751782-Hanusia_phi.AAC.4